MNVRRRPLTIFNVRPFLMAFVWDSLSRLDTMDLSHFRCTPVNGHCFAPHFCLSEGAIAPQRPMCFWLISSRKPMCSTWFYRFAEFSNCFAREPISSIEIEVGAVRVKVSHWQDSIPLSSRLCPSVFRLVYRPYRSFRFVFSSLVVSTSFVSFASRFVLCLTFSSFFVLLFSFNLFLLNKQFSFLYEFVSSCEVLLTLMVP